MRPTLFHFIYGSLSERFPLLPRIRRSFMGLLLFCVLGLLIDLSGQETTISVRPVLGSGYYRTAIASYQTDTVLLSGNFSVKHPGIALRMMAPGSFTGLDLFTLLCLTAGCCLVIRMLPHTKNDLFKKDISSLIRGLGFLLMLHGLVMIFKTAVFIPKEIETLTNKQFTGNTSFPIMVWAELYVSLIVFALAGFYKRGMKLQEEQDLTV